MSAKTKTAATPQSTNQEFEYFITPLGISKAPLVTVAAGVGSISLTVNNPSNDTELKGVKIKVRATPGTPAGEKEVLPATQEQLKLLYEDAKYGGAGGFNGYIGKRAIQ